MSNYKTHSTFNTLFAFPLFLFGLYYFFSPSTKNLIIFSSCFLYATFFMSPDMDLANKIKIFSIRGFLSLPFRFYAWIFSHRGLSHSLLLGSLTRILWLVGLGLLILFLMDMPMSKKQLLAFYQHNKPYILYGFAGIFTADVSHLFLDAFHTKK